MIIKLRREVRLREASIGMLADIDRGQLYGAEILTSQDRIIAPQE
jgi:hypothetical protein